MDVISASDYRGLVRWKITKGRLLLMEEQTRYMCAIRNVKPEDLELVLEDDYHPTRNEFAYHFRVKHRGPDFESIVMEAG